MVKSRASKIQRGGQEQGRFRTGETKAREEPYVATVIAIFKIENNSFELTRIFKESFNDQR